MKKVAILPTNAVGDSLVFAILAYNLTQNGYQVIVFSNVLFQLKSWFSKIGEIKPLPVSSELITELQDFAWIMADYERAFINELMHDQSLWPKTSVVLTINSHEVKLLPQKRSPVEQYRLFALAHGKVFENFGKREPMAQKAAIFCREQLQLKNATHLIPLTPPAQLQYRRNKQRVFISAEAKLQFSYRRSWENKKFIKLAQKLCAKGMQPIFSVIPALYNKWRAQLPSAIDLLYTPSLGQLADVLYESGYAISNDSGVGHLASLLQIPVLVIYKYPNKLYVWRPGWGANIFLTPWFKSPFKHNFLWKKIITVRKVLRAFNKLMRDTQ